LHPETKAEAFKGNQHTGKVAGENSAFTTTTAETIGKSRRSIEIAAARGEALGDDLVAVAGTSLDKGVELDALAKMTPEARAPLIERAKAGGYGGGQSLSLNAAIGEASALRRAERTDSRAPGGGRGACELLTEMQRLTHRIVMRMHF
jgi:hypothetical protein